MSQYPGSPSHNNVNNPNNMPQQYPNMPSNVPVSSPMRYNNSNMSYGQPSLGTPLSHQRNGYTVNGNISTNGTMPTGGMAGMTAMNPHSSKGGVNGTSMNMSGANPQQNSPHQVNNLHGNNNADITNGNGNGPVMPNNPISINVNNNPPFPSQNNALNGASLTTNTKSSNKSNTALNTNAPTPVVNASNTEQVAQTQSSKTRIKWDNDDRFESGYLDSVLRQAFNQHQGASWKDISITFRTLVYNQTQIRIEISADLCRQRYTRINSRPVDLTDKDVVMKLVMLDHNNSRFAWKEWAEENLKPNPNKVPIDDRPIDGDRVKNAFHQLKGALDHYKKDRKMPGRTTLPPPAQEVIIEVAHKQLGIPDVPKLKPTPIKGSNNVNPTPSTPKNPRKKGNKKPNEEDKSSGAGNTGNKTPMGSMINNPITPSHNYPHQMYNMFNGVGGTPMNTSSGMNTMMPNSQFASPNPQFGMNMGMPNVPNASPMARTYGQSMGPNQGPYNYGMMSPNSAFGYTNNQMPMSSPMSVNGMMGNINPNPMLTPNRKNINPMQKQNTTNGQMMQGPMSSPSSHMYHNSQKAFPNQNVTIPQQHSAGSLTSSTNNQIMNQAPQTPKPYYPPYAQPQATQNQPTMMPPHLQTPMGPYPNYNAKMPFNSSQLPMNSSPSPFPNKQEFPPQNEAKLQTPSNKKIKVSPTATPQMSHYADLHENKPDQASPNPPPPIDTKGGISTPFQMSPYNPYTPISNSMNPSPQHPTSTPSSTGQPFLGNADTTSSFVNQNNHNATTNDVYNPSYNFSNGGSAQHPFVNTNSNQFGTGHQQPSKGDDTHNMNHSGQVFKANSGYETLVNSNDTDTVNTEPNSTTLSPPAPILGKRKGEDKPSREELEKENTNEGQVQNFELYNGGSHSEQQQVNKLPSDMKTFNPNFAGCNTENGTASTTATHFANPEEFKLKTESTASDN